MTEAQCFSAILIDSASEDVHQTLPVGFASLKIMVYRVTDTRFSEERMNVCGGLNFVCVCLC